MRNVMRRLWGNAGSVENGAEGAAASHEHELDTPRRKTVVPLWRRKSTVILGLFLGFGMISGVGTWAVKSGWMLNAFNQTKWAMISSAAEQGFTVEDVLVTGRGETKRVDLLDAMGIVRGAPILAYDFKNAKARVEGLPWVLQARVERLLPDTLVVHLTERRPIALWQNHGEFSLIDEEGEIITREGLGRFSDLIHVVGADAPSNVGGLLELLETQPELKDQVKAAVRVGGRRWDLILTGGVDVRLPEVGAPAALARLVAFEHESGVLAREIKVLDLRTPDRIVVRRGSSVLPSGVKIPAYKVGQET